MREHHRKAITRLTEHFREDPAFPALIIGGSVMKGTAREDSDIDAVFVASKEEYTRRLTGNDIHYYSEAFCDYPGGYVDGKIVDYAFLQELDDHGSEVARAAFIGARVAYSRIEGLPELLDSITRYRVEEKEEKMASFYAQLEVWFWYFQEAMRRQDRYLLHRSAVQMVLFGGRLLLAHNEVLFGYHKHLLHQLEHLPHKPPQLLKLANALFQDPQMETANAFYKTVRDFHEWPQPQEGWPSRFMKDTEWNWRAGLPTIEDR